MKDSRNISFSISNIQRLNNRLFQLDLLNFNNAEGEMSLNLKGIYGQNEAGNKFDKFSGKFIPTNLVPIDIPIPEVEAIWNE